MMHRSTVLKVIVKEGEAMLIDTAHEVRYLEDTLAYELKNGPFIDDRNFLTEY